jgi:O-antigen/teichoic acid export membrane protein
MITKKDSIATRYSIITSKSLLYLGVLILISALIYMLANFAKADTIISIWLPFMISGVFLVFMSQMIRWKFVKFQE